MPFADGIMHRVLADKTIRAAAVP